MINTTAITNNHDKSIDIDKHTRKKNGIREQLSHRLQFCDCVLQIAPKVNDVKQ